MVYRFYDLCKKIWGGSPATERIDTGVETVDLEDLTQASNQIHIEDANIVESQHPEQSSDQPANNKSDQPANIEYDQSANSESDQPGNRESDQPDNRESDQLANRESDQPDNRESDQAANSTCDQPGNSQEVYKRGCNRRGEVDYKQQKLKKKISADKQLMHFAEQELELQKRMMERLETSDKEHREMMNSLTANLKTLSDTMSTAFSLLQQSMPIPGHYGHHYGHYPVTHGTPPPSVYQSQSGFFPNMHPGSQYGSLAPSSESDNSFSFEDN